ncbi:bifunctional phosphoribosylaminoimidazolecarboxamide formyltransferase/inosine monophosphate cyclohydrolase [Candidatus Peregrinibacteria bacterium CG10_big_fil_rev_8_21_14_0_10_55_24]|nr:MAG: bifunctional phosphoribosylaminoimidazolecarboxamide formyltransferase/inosine monophosphate cyclohydrolase [Candidatus Peregrinibacteria bacterium CG10_big_fil_rev_8_21_14_0_10_55_24]
MAKRALLSVSDKSGIADLARVLWENGYEILSTGGTKKALEEAKIPVISVEEVTRVPACFSGRVKTLHPLIAGAILYRRGDPSHEKEAQELGIKPIDFVVVNLYPFAETAKKPGITRLELIEQIDIGGPTLLRSAAKNAESVTVLCDPSDYERVMAELKTGGETSQELRRELAEKVFLHTAAYDLMITQTLSEGDTSGMLLIHKMPLRYGENPHQWGAFYELHGDPPGWTVVQQAEGKPMSYLNILDADGAWNLVCEFSEPTAACIKHANPSGVAVHEDIAEAFQRSYDADRLSAFGVIIALNRPCPGAVMEKIIEQKIFAELLIAPGFTPEALALLKERPKLRVIEYRCPENSDIPSFRSALGGMLVQNLDTRIVREADLTVSTDAKPTAKQIEDLLFAWSVVKHAKSNAIVFAKDHTTVGIGAGQTSRVDSTIIAARRAGEKAKGAVMASDAFFPFPDSVEEAAKHGISAIIQPGGSIRDEEVIAKANELKIPMVFTGVRGFRH